MAVPNNPCVPCTVYETHACIPTLPLGKSRKCSLNLPFFFFTRTLAVLYSTAAQKYLSEGTRNLFENASKIAAAEKNKESLKTMSVKGSIKIGEVDESKAGAKLSFDVFHVDASKEFKDKESFKWQITMTYSKLDEAKDLKANIENAIKTLLNAAPMPGMIKDAFEALKFNVDEKTKTCTFSGPVPMLGKDPFERVPIAPRDVMKSFSVKAVFKYGLADVMKGGMKALKLGQAYIAGSYKLSKAFIKGFASTLARGSRGRPSFRVRKMMPLILLGLGITEYDGGVTFLSPEQVYESLKSMDMFASVLPPDEIVNIDPKQGIDAALGMMKAGLQKEKTKLEGRLESNKGSKENEAKLKVVVLAAKVLENLRKGVTDITQIRITSKTASMGLNISAQGLLVPGILPCFEELTK